MAQVRTSLVSCRNEIKQQNSKYDQGLKECIPLPSKEQWALIVKQPTVYSLRSKPTDQSPFFKKRALRSKPFFYIVLIRIWKLILCCGFALLWQVFLCPSSQIIYNIDPPPPWTFWAWAPLARLKMIALNMEPLSWTNSRMFTFILPSARLLQHAPAIRPSVQNRSDAHFSEGGASPQPCRGRSCSQWELTHWHEWRRAAPEETILTFK